MLSEYFSNQKLMHVTYNNNKHTEISLVTCGKTEQTSNLTALTAWRAANCLVVADNGAKLKKFERGISDDIHTQGSYKHLQMKLKGFLDCQTHRFQIFQGLRNVQNVSYYYGRRIHIECKGTFGMDRNVKLC